MAVQFRSMNPMVSHVLLHVLVHVVLHVVPTDQINIVIVVMY